MQRRAATPRQEPSDDLASNFNRDGTGSPGNTWVALSTGAGVGDGSIWLSGWCSHGGAIFGRRDLNGDGAADLLCE